MLIQLYSQGILGIVVSLRHIESKTMKVWKTVEMRFLDHHFFFVIKNIKFLTFYAIQSVFINMA